MKTLKFDNNHTFAPGALLHLAIATGIVALLLIASTVTSALAVGPVGIPGPLNPDPEAYAVDLGETVMIVPAILICDEGEGVCEDLVRKLTRVARRKGADMEILWIGAGVDMDPEVAFIQWWLWVKEFWGGWMYGPNKPSPK